MRSVLLLLAIHGLPALPALAGLTPLTESQLIRLETADDRSDEIREAAFYALLENVADWPRTRAGAVIPDYADILDQPQVWRGRPCLIEGTLQTRLPARKLERGWEKVRGLTIDIHPDKPMAEKNEKDFVIVYLTEPPDVRGAVLQWNDALLDETGTRVEVVARFYKLQDSGNRGGATKSYMAFVGRNLKLLGGKSGAPAWRIPALMGAIVLMMAAFWWRLRRLRQGFAAPARATSLASFIDQRRAEREGENEETELEPPPDLPEDPVDALGILAGDRAEATEAALEQLGREAESATTEQIDTPELPARHGRS
ncbi:MAG: hypothetical protein OER86_03440 [Phycisphaerae bacterium]|nr:hypothetical protein [Phycisphaerae bacterium]